MSDTEQKNMLSENDSDNEQDTKQTDIKKMSLAELSQHLIELTNTQEEIANTFNEKEKLFEQVRREFALKCKKYRKDITTATKRMEALSKQKTKRTKSSGQKGGFVKKSPVPKILCKYLGLDEDSELSRSEIGSLLNSKLKEDNCRDGKNLVFKSKNIAKQLGIKPGTIVGFTEYQSFIKTFYDGTTFVSKSVSENSESDNDTSEPETKVVKKKKVKKVVV